MSFDIIINRVLGHEKGYVNDPNDPGGETSWGISKRSYPNVDIKNLTRESAIEIYRKDFWEHLNVGSLPDGILFQLLDFAVNSGIDTAIRYFQRVLGVADDGHFGPISRKAALTMSESDMILGINAERLEFMTKLKNWPNAGRGWARRIAQNLRYGIIDN